MVKLSCIAVWLSLVLLKPLSVSAQPDAEPPESAPSGEGTGDDAAGEAEEGEPTDEAATEDTPDEAPTDLDALRARYRDLRDRLFRSRARAATVASAMFSTRIRINLHYGTGRFYTVTRATIRLDGANVFDDIEGVVAEDRAPRFEGFVAPGRHVVTIRIEATGKDDERFSSSQESSFVIQAPAGKDVIVDAVAEDEGNIPFEWEDEEKGSYELHLDVDVKTRKRDSGSGGGAIKRSERNHATTRMHARR